MIFLILGLMIFLFLIIAFFHLEIQIFLKFFRLKEPDISESLMMQQVKAKIIQMLNMDNFTIKITEAYDNIEPFYYVFNNSSYYEIMRLFFIYYNKKPMNLNNLTNEEMNKISKKLFTCFIKRNITNIPFEIVDFDFSSPYGFRVNFKYK